MIVNIDEIKTLRAENERLRAEAKSSPVPVLLAEIKRLRAIEAAAMNIAQVAEESDDPCLYVPITARQFAALKAALAAKGEA
jgi:hypothetical protein